VEHVSLLDEAAFETSSGLWKGKKGPFATASVIRNTNFTESGRVDYSDVAVLDVEVRQLANRRLKNGDIIIERSGGGPNQPVGRVVFFERSDGIFSHSNFTSRLRVVDTNRFFPRFVFYFLLYFHDSKQTDHLQRRTTGIRNLDWRAYRDTARVPLFDLQEQKQIAQLLATVQHMIERQETLIALASELKKSLMHSLFTHGTRSEVLTRTDVGPLPLSWEVTHLGSIAKIGNGSTPKRDKAAYWNGGTIPWLTSGKIHEGRITKPDEWVTEAATAECHLPLVPAGSLLVAITGEGKTLGNAALVEFDTCVSQHLAYVKFHRADVVPAFVLYFLQYQYSHLRQMSIGAGSTKKALTCGLLKRFPVPLPPKDEQNLIASVLDAVISKIDLHKQTANCMRSLFRTLLYQLMTAQIRVRDLDLSTFSTGEVELTAVS
jgi:type I restriction enzyme, S subunit